MSSVLQSIYDGLLNLLYEPKCPFDIEHSCSLEKSCFADGWSNKVCELCFNELVDLDLQPRQVFPLNNVYSAAKYLHGPKELIHKLKWTEPKLARPMAELMAYQINHSLVKLDFDYIVPIPGFVTEERAWIPSLLLAKELSNILKIPYFDNALLKIQETKFCKLNKKERIKLVNSAYQRINFVDEKLKTFDELSRKILLVDDLITSGATLKTCAKCLKQGNSEHQITGLTFACVTNDN